VISRSSEAAASHGAISNTEVPSRSATRAPVTPENARRTTSKFR